VWHQAQGGSFGVHDVALYRPPDLDWSWVSMSYLGVALIKVGNKLINRDWIKSIELVPVCEKPYIEEHFKITIANTERRGNLNGSYDPEELVLKDSPDFARIQRIFQWHCQWQSPSVKNDCINRPPPM
jgi:hypothetical protein